MPDHIIVHNTKRCGKFAQRIDGISSISLLDDEIFITTDRGSVSVVVPDASSPADVFDELVTLWDRYIEELEVSDE